MYVEFYDSVSDIIDAYLAHPSDASAQHALGEIIEAMAEVEQVEAEQRSED